MVLWGAGMIISLWFPSYAGAQDEVNRKLAAGEIMVSTQEVPGKSVQSAEMMGVIDAPPEIVWQVINDVNNFKNFMPRTRISMAVAPEKIPLILQKRPTRAAEVEKLLGPIPADPASYRVPGGVRIPSISIATWISRGPVTTAGTSSRG